MQTISTHQGLLDFKKSTSQRAILEEREHLTSTNVHEIDLNHDISTHIDRIDTKMNRNDKYMTLASQCTTLSGQPSDIREMGTSANNDAVQK